MRIEEQSHEQQVKRLVIILSPARSRIRPYLGLYGFKNCVLLRNGCLEGNSPTTMWYLGQLRTGGITRNYWNVRRHLKGMAGMGVFCQRKTARLVENSLATSKRLTRVEVCEFHLAESIFPAMHEALRLTFRTDSIASLYNPAN